MKLSVKIYWRNIPEFFQQQWDWFIYRRAYHSIRRICERNVGFAYLLELYIRDWREKHLHNEPLMRATEEFYRSLKDAPHADR